MQLKDVITKEKLNRFYEKIKSNLHLHENKDVLDKFSESNSGKAVYGNKELLNGVEITKAEYDALVKSGTIDENILYIVKDDDTDVSLNGKDYVSKKEISNEQTVSEEGYALDARQNNPDVVGSLRNSIKSMYTPSQIDSKIDTLNNRIGNTAYLEQIGKHYASDSATVNKTGPLYIKIKGMEVQTVGSNPFMFDVVLFEHLKTPLIFRVSFSSYGADFHVLPICHPSESRKNIQFRKYSVTNDDNTIDTIICIGGTSTNSFYYPLFTVTNVQHRYAVLEKSRFEIGQYVSESDIPSSATLQATITNPYDEAYGWKLIGSLTGNSTGVGISTSTYSEFEIFVKVKRLCATGIISSKAIGSREYLVELGGGYYSSSVNFNVIVKVNQEWITLASASENGSSYISSSVITVYGR